MRRAVLGFVIIAFFSQACGTIIHGTSQNLSISTEPPGAIATVGTQQCITPCSLSVSRKAKHITIKKGTFEKTYELTKRFHSGSVILGNILWLLPGVIIDVVSGGAYTIEPVNIKLEEKGGLLFEKGRTTISDIINIWSVPKTVEHNGGYTIYHFDAQLRNEGKHIAKSDVKVLVDENGIVQDIIF